MMSAAVVALTFSCLSLPTAVGAGVSYSTEVSPWPSAVSCLNSEGTPTQAKEVLLGSRKTVVIAGGTNPISDADWARYTPSIGNQKNSDRHLLFGQSCFSRSPSRTVSCEGEACREIFELDGHTWVGLSKIEAADCVPGPSNCDGASAKPGGLLFVVTRKCHELTFENEAWFLTGPAGQRAIMHATANGMPTGDVSLPAGWSLKKEALTAPLRLRPFGGGDECFYNIIRDEKLQSYHQFEYGSARYP